jgi:hypothetical protein
VYNVQLRALLSLAEPSNKRLRIVGQPKLWKKYRELVCVYVCVAVTMCMHALVDMHVAVYVQM